VWRKLKCPVNKKKYKLNLVGWFVFNLMLSMDASENFLVGNFETKKCRKFFDTLVPLFRANSIIIVKIDSRTLSFCLRQYVQNGLSYSGKETRPMLCINDAKLRSGIQNLERNKHQLLHRITSIKDTTNLQYNT